MADTQTTIAFTGGGTAGHVFPAFPVVERLMQDGFHVEWIGSSNGMERRLVEEASLKYHGIPAGKLRRYFSFRNFTDLFRIFLGFLAAVRILRRMKPAALVSKGGFVSVPPMAAARLLGIPRFTHESDVDPGLATRLNLKLGARPVVAYEKTLSYLPAAVKARAVVAGNPVRDVFFTGDRDLGREAAGLSPDDPRPLILVLGGSQGAAEVNTLITGVLETLLEKAVVVHQYGKGHEAEDTRPGYKPQAFIGPELPHLMAAADLAVGRSGAGSVWEFAATGTPAVFIPLRGATRGDQILNAQMAKEAGFAEILPEKADAGELGTLILSILENPGRLETMARAAKAYPAASAADVFARAVKEYCT